MTSEQVRILFSILFKGSINQVLTRTGTNAFGFEWADATGGGSLSTDLDEGDSTTVYGPGDTYFSFDEGSSA